MKVAFVCFGEVNTPYERLVIKHDEALAALSCIDAEILDAGIVIDDAAYKTADAAIEKLKFFEMDCLIICVAGWIPTHAVIRVTDVFRHKPMLLWGLCGWTENGKIITTAGQAGTTALRPTFEAMGYKFKYIYNVIGEPLPLEKITAFLNACYSASRLRTARIGTMGYRDMLLYGTQFEGNSLRAEIGVEVEPFEIYEMAQNTGNLDDNDIKKTLQYIRENWKFEKPCEDEIIETGIRYALAIGKKIEERNFDAVTLIDVDGMKKLLGFPPAMVFMLLDYYYNVPTIPENDVLGNAMQLILKYITGQNAAYMEYYEFFKNSVLIGVPDYVPSGAVKGDIKVKPTAFGLLSASLLNVSEVKTGLVTCARLIYKKNGYYMHIYTGNAKPPRPWEEFGWKAPAPVLPSLEVEMISCSVEEFAQKVSSQHVIIAYGDYTESLKDFCSIMGIQVI
jgi:L-arabinose isomerase